ncbi:unnamed protein product [Arabidopsis lyrata]|uniref:Uncharacterized protein n=1 Tax=Arabidopsis lyrata subsp. lyrata TaxID=81972 RepID=D7KZH8_ARALL|nr:hypothetical protein ARALYDRAFT_896221 [Arabidopsis lyrata subsp. lyrata]CAH8259042.1 unnamed protein product [Arabidopsis lyrata]
MPTIISPYKNSFEQVSSQSNNSSSKSLICYTSIVISTGFLWTQLDMESIIMSLRRKEKKSQSRRLGKYLKEQKGRIYIIRRCVMMLLCSCD